MLACKLAANMSARALLAFKGPCFYKKKKRYQNHGSSRSNEGVQETSFQREPAAGGGEVEMRKSGGSQRSGQTGGDEGKEEKQGKHK